MPGHALGDHVVARPVRIGADACPRIPEAADTAVDDARIARRHSLIADPQPVHHAGAHVLDDRIRPFAQLEQDLAVRRVLEVEHDATLVAVDAGEEAAEVDTVRPTLARPLESRWERRYPTRSVAAGRLDFDDVGAEVAQQRRSVGPGERHRAVDHGDVGQGAGRARGGTDHRHCPIRSARSIRFCTRRMLAASTITPSTLIAPRPCRWASS